MILVVAIGFARSQSVPVVKSVAGCDFHASRSSVRTKLINKFGTAVEDTEKVLSFSDVEIGGFLYDYVEFFFKYDSKKMVNEFVSTIFQHRFYTFERDNAEDYYQKIVDAYKRKYGNLQSVVYDDVRLSACGPLPEDAVHDSDFPIIIMMKEGVSKGGDKYIYVTVYYYYNEIENLYDDEI